MPVAASLNVILSKPVIWLLPPFAPRSPSPSGCRLKVSPKLVADAVIVVFDAPFKSAVPATTVKVAAELFVTMSLAFASPVISTVIADAPYDVSIVIVLLLEPSSLTVSNVPVVAVKVALIAPDKLRTSTLLNPPNTESLLTVAVATTVSVPSPPSTVSVTASVPRLIVSLPPPDEILSLPAEP